MKLDVTGMKSLTGLFLALSLVGKGENTVYCQFTNEFAFLQFTFSSYGQEGVSWNSKWDYDLRCNAKNLDLKSVTVPFCGTCDQVYGQ